MEGGIYLVSERECMVTTTGAFNHIQMGLKELRKSFNIVLIKNFKETIHAAPRNQKKGAIAIRYRDNRPFVGLLRDIKILFSNHTLFFRTLKKIYSEKPAFIYERTSYLNFTGLIIARLLGIKHFYEANGVQYPRNDRYYASYFNPIAEFLEKMAYKRSNFTFFVGTHGDFLKLKSSNWKNIENGVEKCFLEKSAHTEKKFSGKINFCFVANLMEHHSPDFFIEACRKMKTKEKICLHLIGAGMENMYEKLALEMEVVLHGFINRGTLLEVMKDMHVGIISGSKRYSSHMKLFDYACFKCVVIAPDVYNFKYWFKEDELVFFKNGDSEDMAAKMDEICLKYSEFTAFSNRLFDKVKNKFTWEYIFNDIKRHIQQQYAIS